MRAPHRHVDALAPTRWPKAEEVFDVNFWAIVADCRALVAGTLAARPLGAFASRWRDPIAQDAGDRSPERRHRRRTYARRCHPKEAQPDALGPR